ncbi:unnamed protein product [Adineta ricciae]|uniref:Uncharacterized protein n=1 Tax=Adineta ricciae TaxID=249248 RepID=A0A814ED44_ADIRI|nr:unnamed protein product [Adineta ricciae]CAF0994685.1 unnamed protein product [Adineta ricciae]
MTDNTRRMISEWLHQVKYNHVGETKRKFYADLCHAKAVIKVAAADSKVSEQTRQWVIGYSAAMGAPEEVLDLTEKYKPLVEDGTVPFHSKSGLDHARYGQLWLFYDGFRAAIGGEELSPEKTTAIYAQAKKMIIDEEKIKQIEEIVDKEEKLRKRRLELLFPNGVGTAIREVAAEK